jgi:hypothetical protein
MDKKPQKGSQQSTKPPLLKISAKKLEPKPKRIAQGDIFQDIEILEHLDFEGSILTVQKISFPFVICLNQECDLESDYTTKNEKLCDKNLLHLAIAPAFIFEHYLKGNHWGDIFSSNSPQKRSDSIIKKITDNEIPRYHYLNFQDQDGMPELIIDFKHFFTINKNVIYKQIDTRMCSIDDLFKEKINQRFSYYISRIGLPELTSD